MHVITKSALTNYLANKPEASTKILSWYRTIKACNAKDFNELKTTFNTADYVPKKYTVFDVGGNDYRIVTVINYNTQRIYIRMVGTHVDYDKWTRSNKKNEHTKQIHKYACTYPCMEISANGRTVTSNSK